MGGGIFTADSRLVMLPMLLVAEIGNICYYPVLDCNNTGPNTNNGFIPTEYPLGTGGTLEPDALGCYACAAGVTIFGYAIAAGSVATDAG